MSLSLPDPAAVAPLGSGLSSAEAARRLLEFGPNAVAEERVHPALRVLRHFWSPVPWMLEIAIVLQIAVGERLESPMIATLLVVNVALGVFQESRANAALALLKARLSLKARVKRDGGWRDALAAELVTGDNEATAAAIARAIGLEGAVCPAGKIPESVGPEDFAIYAGVFPEDKFRPVKALQQRGHAVGMCGDGANDAPTLRQAQMGIAVSTATDVAKSAAGIVLTTPGLGGIVASIKEGRSGFQRVLTYTMSQLVNKSAMLVVLVVGLVITAHAVMTPVLQALAMLAGDLVSMSRAADRAAPTPYPNTWRIRNLTLASLPLGLFKFSYCIAVLATGWFVIGLGPATMRTMTFLMLVLAGQASVYVLRERVPLWRSRPAPVMLFASLADLVIVTSLAIGGVLMAPLAPAIAAALFAATLGFALAFDGVKRIVFARLRVD